MNIIDVAKLNLEAAAAKKPQPDKDAPKEDHLAKYTQLMRESAAHQRAADALAQSHQEEDRPLYEHHAGKAWRLGTQAMEHFKRMTKDQRGMLRDQSWGQMQQQLQPGQQQRKPAFGGNKQQFQSRMQAAWEGSVRADWSDFDNNRGGGSSSSTPKNSAMSKLAATHRQQARFHLDRADALFNRDPHGAGVHTKAALAHNNAAFKYQNGGNGKAAADKAWATTKQAAGAENSALRGPFPTVKSSSVAAVSPPGWKGTTEHMKNHPKISNPYALAWSQYKKGDQSHVEPPAATPRVKVSKETRKARRSGLKRRKHVQADWTSFDEQRDEGGEPKVQETGKPGFVPVGPREVYNEARNGRVVAALKSMGFKPSGPNADPKKDVFYIGKMSRLYDGTSVGSQDEAGRAVVGRTVHTVRVCPNGEWEHTSEGSHDGVGARGLGQILQGSARKKKK